MRSNRTEMNGTKHSMLLTRRLRRLALTTLALAAGGCTILDPDPEATINQPPAVEMTGETLYLNHCAGCHGIGGTPSDTSTIKTLRGYAKSYDSFDSTLDMAPGIMPLFPQLDSAERMKIYDHIRKFPPP